MHYTRYRRYGDPTTVKQFQGDLEARFWQKVEKTDSCWVWTGSRNVLGYGQFRVAGRAKQAHRVSYELHIGPIAKELVIDHLCKNPSCVNPEHLEPVSTRVNVVVRGDGPTAVNAAKTHCVRGHLLDEDNVYIRKGKNGPQRICRQCRRDFWKTYVRPSDRPV